MELIGITGASGKLGRATIGFLLERDTPPNAVVAIVRDPATPINLLPAYDTGDHLHLNPTGYKAMAEAINLNLFTP